MRLSKHTIGAAAIAAMSTTTMATTSFCPANSDGPCYAWGVPEVAASSGSGNVYFQLRAPTKYEWVGLGIGSMMRGAHIFVMYADGKGNVTISPREGRGHVMPQHVDRPDVELLAGSGIVDGHMVANVKCGKCSDLDLKGSNGWIAAWKEGDAINSPEMDATITYHDEHHNFNVDFANAKVSSDSNPFTGAVSNPTTGGSGPGVTTSKGSDNSDMLKWAHGIIMMIVFTAMYPMGSALMPLLGKWYIHASWQMIAFLLMWAGFGIGYTLAHRAGMFFMGTHTRLGVFVVTLMGIQPILGWVHHGMYKKNQSRGVFSYIHVWYGRALMILGIVNGGLGLQLAGLNKPFMTAFIVVAVVFSLIYVASTLLKAFRGGSGSSRSSNDTDSEPKPRAQQA